MRAFVALLGAAVLTATGYESRRDYVMKRATKKPNKTARLKAMRRRKLQKARLRMSKGERKYSR